MEFNYLAFAFLLTAFAFAYLMQNCKIKYDFIWLALASICAGLYILLVFMGGDGLFNAALGLTLLSIAVFKLNEKGDKKLCCLIQ